MYSGKDGCIRATWFYSGKVVVFGQIGCDRAFLLYPDSGFIRGKVLVFGQSGCIRAKVVVFGQKWLF